MIILHEHKVIVKPKEIFIQHIYSNRSVFMKRILKRFTKYNEEIKIHCDGRYFRTFFDIMWCRLRYGFTPYEYFLWTIYDFSGIKRRTLISSRIHKKFDKKNSHEIEMIFRNKESFLENYSQFAKRDYLDITKSSFEDFYQFVKKNNEVIIKPIWASQGFGIRQCKYTTPEDMLIFYNDIQDDNKAYGLMAEGKIIQHHKMYSVGENSVNTIRVVTYVYNSEVYIVGCTLRMGGNECYDNYSAGGFCAEIDKDTGIVTTYCFRDNNNYYIRHPYTNTVLPGFQIPHWDKVINICKEAAKFKPGANYIGWDVAILEDDVLLIEGNTNQGIFQEADKVGKYKIIKDIEAGRL